MKDPLRTRQLLRLYDTYGHECYRVARHLLHNRVDAENAVLTVFSALVTPLSPSRLTTREHLILASFRLCRQWRADKGGTVQVADRHALPPDAKPDVGDCCQPGGRPSCDSVGDA